MVYSSADLGTILANDLTGAWGSEKYEMMLCQCMSSRGIWSMMSRSRARAKEKTLRCAKGGISFTNSGTQCTSTTKHAASDELTECALFCLCWWFLAVFGVYDLHWISIGAVMPRKSKRNMDAPLLSSLVWIQSPGQDAKRKRREWISQAINAPVPKLSDTPSSTAAHKVCVFQKPTKSAETFPNTSVPSGA